MAILRHPGSPQDGCVVVIDLQLMVYWQALQPELWEFLYFTRLSNSMLGTLHSEKLDDCMIPCWAGMLHMVKLQVRKVACCR